MQLKEMKTSLFGFNKNDVYEYISQLNSVCERKVQQAKEEQRESINTLNRKNEELNDSISALSQKNADLKREADCLRENADKANAKAEELRQRVDEIRFLLASLFENISDQLDSLNEQIGGLMTEKCGESKDER